MVFIFSCLVFLALGFVLPKDARAAITLVNSANNANSGSGGSISATLNAISGNLLVVVCRHDTTPNDTQSVSDAAGNRFFPVISTGVPNSGSSADFIKMWYAKNII